MYDAEVERVTPKPTHTQRSEDKGEYAITSAFAYLYTFTLSINQHRMYKALSVGGPKKVEDLTVVSPNNHTSIPCRVFVHGRVSAQGLIFWIDQQERTTKDLLDACHLRGLG